MQNFICNKSFIKGGRLMIDDIDPIFMKKLVFLEVGK